MNARFPSIMKETRRKSLLPTTTLNRQGKYNCVAKKGKLACASFPYSTSTSALSKTTLHREGNITHAIFPSIM